MAKIKTVYQYDEKGFYTGPEIAFESPLEPGVYPLPARCTEVEPPAVAEGNAAQWDGSQWQEVPAPVPDDPVHTDPETPNNPYVTWDTMASAFREGVNSYAE